MFQERRPFYAGDTRAFVEEICSSATLQSTGVQDVWISRIAVRTYCQKVFSEIQIWYKVDLYIVESKTYVWLFKKTGVALKNFDFLLTWIKQSLISTHWHRQCRGADTKTSLFGTNSLLFHQRHLWWSNMPLLVQEAEDIPRQPSWTEVLISGPFQ